MWGSKISSFFEKSKLQGIKTWSWLENVGERRGRRDKMNTEFRKKSRTDCLKALVFESYSVLLQADIPSSPIKKYIRIWEFVSKRCWKACQNSLWLWPLKNKRQSLGISENMHRVTWKPGKCRDWGGDTDISAGQIGPKGPADFAERGFSLDVFVMEPNNVHVLRYCPGKDVCAIL